ncbi:phosphoribosyltransferase, partial [Paracoccus sp. PXZ]
IVAVPVAPPDVLEKIRAEADEVVCLRTPEPFHAVGLHYRDFDQTSDGEVVRTLAEAERGKG